MKTLKKHLWIISIVVIMTTYHSWCIDLTGYTISDVCHAEICHGPIVVNYELIDENNKVVSVGRSDMANEGRFEIKELKKSTQYQFIIKDTAFLRKVLELRIPDDFNYDFLSKDITVVPKADGVAYFCTVSPFEFRKSRIRKGIQTFLEDIVGMMKLNEDVLFEINSYPDDDSDEQKNLELTFNRCNELRDFLIEMGVSAEKLLTSPHHKTDEKNPPYDYKAAKGKRYVGSTYIVLRTKQ
jgi:hypothetical protein